MKKIAVVMLAVCMLFLCACDVAEAPAPTASPSPNISYISSEDAPLEDSVYPLHVSGADGLLRLSYSGGHLKSRVMCSFFSFYYANQTYEIIKYYKSDDILYYATDYRVENGNVLCTLVRYSGGETTQTENNVCADSIRFAEYPAVAYISVSDGLYTLRYRIKDMSHPQVVDTGVLSCEFSNRYNQLVYLKSEGDITKARQEINQGSSDFTLMYYDTVNKPLKLGQCGAILDIDTNTGRVITAQNQSDLTGGFSKADIKVFYTLTATSYTVPDAIVAGQMCVGGCVIAGDNLVSLTATGAKPVAEAVRMQYVSNDSGVVFTNKAGQSSYYAQDKIQKLSVPDVPSAAYRCDGGLYLNTAQGLYRDGVLLLKPQQLTLSNGVLYASYLSGDGISSSICKIDKNGTEVLVKSATNQGRFHVISGKVLYFVHTNLISDSLQLMSAGQSLFDNVSPEIVVLANATLAELVVHNADGNLIALVDGQRILSIAGGKILL